MSDNKELNADIGGRIRGIREAQRKTREQLAESADISTQFLFEIETGIKSMTARTIINIAKALNVSTDFLLLGNISRASGIADELEGLPPETLRLVEKFLRTFAIGARTEQQHDRT